MIVGVIWLWRKRVKARTTAREVAEVDGEQVQDEVAELNAEIFPEPYTKRVPEMDIVPPVELMAEWMHGEPVHELGGGDHMVVPAEMEESQGMSRSSP